MGYCQSSLWDGIKIAHRFIYGKDWVVLSISPPKLFLDFLARNTYYKPIKVDWPEKEAASGRSRPVVRKNRTVENGCARRETAVDGRTREYIETRTANQWSPARITNRSTPRKGKSWRIETFSCLKKCDTKFPRQFKFLFLFSIFSPQDNHPMFSISIRDTSTSFIIWD